MRRLQLMSMILALVGCAPEAAAPPARQEITVRSDGQKAMHQLSPLNRDIALKRAIYDTGAACLRITRSGYVGKYENTEQWTATCEDKFKRNREWALYVGADDSVQVRLCSDVVKAGLPGCVIKDEAKRAPTAS